MVYGGLRIGELLTDFLFLAAVAFAIASVHMVAPDHWVPLLSVSVKHGYNKAKKYGIAALLGATHALTSGILALIALVIGGSLLGLSELDLVLASTALLTVVGIYFVVNGIRESSEVKTYVTRSVLAVSIIPDFALVPIILSGINLPLAELWAVFLSFLLASTASLTVMIILSSGTLGKRISEMSSSGMDYTIGGLLFMTALVVYLFPSL